MRYVFLAAVLVACSPAARAQAPPQTATPITIDLAGALERAKQYSPQYLAAAIASAAAHEDRVQAKAALLPTLNAFNQYTYTQGNGTPTGVFVANNGVHVYDEQATLHAELFSVTRHAEYRRAMAAEAAFAARREITARGLAATVFQNYYAVIVAQRHTENARRSLDEARRFEDLTEKQERGGEVAHADVVKSQLQLRERERELLDTQTNIEKAKLGLAVLVFADLAQPFSVVDDLRPDAPLPPPDEIRQQAFANNPDIRAAEAGLRQADFGIKAARGLYYPSLVVDYFYGMDSNFFALHNPDRSRNLGSVVQAAVNVPVWNWGATRSKVRQAELQRRQAEVDLNFARRQIEATVTGLYLEGQAAKAQLDSLRNSADLASESLRLTLLRYQGGEATALEVVDAQSALALARNAYDDGLARYRLALANIQTLTGRF
jgi:outer membrane protein TolC